MALNNKLAKHVHSIHQAGLTKSK